VGEVAGSNPVVPTIFSRLGLPPTFELARTPE
jgi:hypothetical protein